MVIRIQTIPNDTQDFSHVLALAKANSKTLGFLPRGAFSNYAANGQLIGAFEKNKLLGYLLYAVNHTARLLYIVHLCVDGHSRKRGIAVELFDRLKEKTKLDFRGVRVRCRRDYEARKVWPKLGFVAVSESEGRSKQGSTLTIWWFDYGHPDLFSFDYQISEEKVRAVIDANIFFELQHPASERDTGAKALLNDWMQESVELCVTREILNEIHRNSDSHSRKEARAFASTFTEVSCPHQEFESVQEELRALFPDNLSERDESDLRQLAWTIGTETPFFVTRDKKLLRMSDKLYAKYGVHVWRPSLLIINQDSLSRETEYRPDRLAGCNLKVERLQASRVEEVEQAFHIVQRETRAEFRNRLHICLSEPRVFEVSVISSHEGYLGLLILDRRIKNQLRIPVFRLTQNRLAATLSRHLLHNAILKASKEERALAVLDDPHLSQIILDALPELGFVSVEGIWAKVNLTLIDTAENLGTALRSLSRDLPDFVGHIECVLEAFNNAISAGNRGQLVRMEKALGPAKILDLDLNTFVIPIRPQWAWHLFDHQLAGQDLFGSEPSLMFNVENAYYRSRKPNVLTFPARILWYVSKGKAKMPGTMAIRACSYLEEVVIDKPKVVFSRFRRLGVYAWSHVFDIAKNDKNERIMAFRFGNTELFKNPIPLAELRKIWSKHNDSTFFPISPFKTNSQMFFELYRIGMNKKAKELSHAS